MTIEDYRLAQALWLADKFPQKGIVPEKVIKIRAEYEPGYSYSEYTFADGRFELWLHRIDDDGQERAWFIDGDELREFDLTEMVVQGLEMLQELKKAV